MRLYAIIVVSKKRWLLGLSPRPRWGSLQRSPVPPHWAGGEHPSPELLQLHKTRHCVPYQTYYPGYATVIERLQCHPGKSGGHVFWCLQSVTECFQSVTDYLQPVTELGTPKNMATALPGMTLQPLSPPGRNCYTYGPYLSSLPTEISTVASKAASECPVCKEPYNLAEFLGTMFHYLSAINVPN